MSGFVGSRAKKRNRNIFLTSTIIIFVGIVIFFFPSLEINNNEIIPDDNIIPDPIEDMTSLVSNIEELELSLYQKDQKIKFRDDQIKQLQIKLKNIQSEYQTATNITENKNLVSLNKYNLLQENFAKLNIKNDKNISVIKNLDKKIVDLNSNLLLINKETDDIILENQILIKENKSFFAKNRKLENFIVDLNNIIKVQKIEIDSQLEEIKSLKDKSHHGG